jgi:hypothetical protein
MDWNDLAEARDRWWTVVISWEFLDWLKNC